MNKNKSKKGFKMTNLRATKKERQKRKDTFTDIKKYWAKNDNEIEEIREEISELYERIDRYRNQIAEIQNKSSKYFDDNFKKYYPDTWGKVKETDTQQEKQNKRDYWLSA
tara:strand:- start:32 stop:361 length:330 start_codon:yes stop_codon:yes gene_type:complete